MDRPEFTRRSVNRLLLGAAIALAAKPAPANETRALFDFAIAGGDFHGLEQALPGLTQGTALSLRREPSNPHDPHAVAVHGPDGKRLGYIPREANAPVATLLGRGARVEAVILRMLNIQRVADLPEALVFTGFKAGDPMIRLTARV